MALPKRKSIPGFGTDSIENLKRQKIDFKPFKEMKFFKLEIELLFSKNKKNLPDKISPPNLSLGADRLLSSYATVLEQVT